MGVKHNKDGGYQDKTKGRRPHHWCKSRERTRSKKPGHIHKKKSEVFVPTREGYINIVSL